MTPGEKTWERDPAKAVPSLRQALALYAISDGKNWTTSLQSSALGTKQVDQIRDVAYEVLLWLADDIRWRKQDHQSGQQLTSEAAAGKALAYLAQAKHAHPPTHAYYVRSAQCLKVLGKMEAAQANTELANKTAPSMPLDHYLLGLTAHDAKDRTLALKAFTAALDMEPTHYWS